MEFISRKSHFKIKHQYLLKNNMKYCVFIGIYKNNMPI